MVPASAELGSRNKSVDSSQPLHLRLGEGAVEDRDAADEAGEADAAGRMDNSANRERAAIADRLRVIKVMGKPERIDA